MSPATAPIRSLPRRLVRPLRAIALSAALLAFTHSCAPSEAAVQAASPTGASPEEPAAARFGVSLYPAGDSDTNSRRVMPSKDLLRWSCTARGSLVSARISMSSLSERK